LKRDKFRSSFNAFRDQLGDFGASAADSVFAIAEITFRSHGIIWTTVFFHWSPALLVEHFYGSSALNGQFIRSE
jgi:hypothetical protein